LSRDIMMEQEISPRNRFVSAILPWLVVVGALAVYVATLNRWVSLHSLLPVARASGWVWQPELGEPLYWLVTYPVRWLPLKAIPPALHLLSATCAALVLALLARSVALLPHDRTHEQRQREHSEFSLLSIRTAWLPPVLAVIVCGLQLTFWEQATSASVEMLNLLVFAYVIRCVLEFRIDERESWLTRAAFVYGLGITNNWALIGFFPVFIAALIWTRGLNFFNLRFLGRMFLWGLAGLLLYLLLPIVQSHSEAAQVPFWQALKANLGSQEGILAALFRGSRQTIALLSLTSLVPLFIIGIRWASYFGDTSRIGVAFATLTFHVVHLMFLIACIWVALDPPFSPRHVGFGLPFLTFYYLGALSVGYFSGYFLLIFKPTAERSSRTPAFLPLVNAAVTGAIFLLFVLTPAALLQRNLAYVRATNGAMLKELGLLFTQGLPEKGAVLLSDDPRRTVLAQMAAGQSDQSKSFVYVDTGSLKYPDYHRYLKKKYGTAWPANVQKQATEPIAAIDILRLILTLAASKSTYYLHPSFGYYFEFIRVEPHGLAYLVSNYVAGVTFPPKPSSVLIAENEDFWARADAQALQPLLKVVKPPPRRAQPTLVDRFTQLAHLEPEPNPDILMLASFYSRALDYWAVELQKSSELKKAAAHFERALELNPDNVAAEVNLECNKSLQEGRKPAVEMSKSVTDSFGKYRSWDTILGDNGPFDEPSFCYEQGQVYMRGRLLRQAIQEFSRVIEFDSNHLSAQLGLAQSYLVAQKPDEALKVVQEIHAREAEFGVNGTNVNQLLYIEAAANLAKTNVAGADTAVQKTLEKFSHEPDFTNLLAYATQAYLDLRFYSNALPLIERHLTLAPDSIRVLGNQGYVYLQMNEFDLAIPPLKKVLTLEPTNYPAMLNLAIALLRSGHLDEAQQYYETLQKAAPTAYQVQYGLGEIAFRRNDTNGVIRNYELYLSNAPPSLEEAKAIRERLAKFKPPPR
jgi:tetratricopeptide (TPR) repeat protein